MNMRFLAHPTTFELRVCRAGYRIGLRPIVGSFFRLVSVLGNGAFWYALILTWPLHAGEAGFYQAAQLAVTAIAGACLYLWLKRWTRRPRPCAEADGPEPLAAPMDEFSFPSGHTLQAVTLTILCMSFSPAWGYLLIPFTISIALSRVVLGLHYPSDVLAGAVIGSLLASVSLLVF